MYKILRYLIYALLIFSFIYQYDLSFIGIPSNLHSIRVSGIILTVIAVVKRISNGNKTTKYNYVNKKYKSYTFFIIGLLFYSLFQLLFLGRGDGNHVIENFINILLFTIPVIWALTKLIKDIDEFCNILLLTCIAQAIVVIMCTFNDDIALGIDLTFNKNFFEFTRECRYAYAGGIACITSTGVVKFSTGLFACVYLYLTSKKNVYLLCFFALSIVACMIARTGFVFFLVGLFVIVNIQQRFNNILRLLFSLIFISIIILTGISYFIDIEELIQLRFGRFLSLNETGIKAGFFDGYFYGEDTYIPPLRLDTILGTGMTTGISADGYKVHVDGGPLRLYSALGLPMCLFSYFFVLNLMIDISKKCKLKLDKSILLMLLVYIMIADFKELSLFLVWPMCIFFIISYLIYKKECNLYEGTTSN